VEVAARVPGRVTERREHGLVEAPARVEGGDAHSHVIEHGSILADGSAAGRKRNCSGRVLVLVLVAGAGKVATAR
jgi:hypothetical protein